MLTEQNKKKAYIYTRVSTKDQVIDGHSLETQKNICMRWIEQNPEYKFENIFVELGISGTKDNRVELTNLKKVVKKDDVIVAYSLHRLVRSLKLWVAFSDIMMTAGVRIICINENIDTNSKTSYLISNIIAVLSQHEVEQIRERTKHNLDEKKKRGELCNGSAPYGYNAFKALNGTLYSYPNLEEQRGIEIIIRHRDAGKSFNEISDFLRQKKIRTKRDCILWSIPALNKIYKREKENREKYEVLLDEEKIREYEAYKAPHTVPYEILKNFIVDGKEFSHESYNDKYHPGANYNGRFYVPKIDQFKLDVQNGYIKVDEQTKLLVYNDFKTEKDDEENDELIARVLKHDMSREIYKNASKYAKSLNEKRDIASGLIKTFCI